LSVRNLLTHRAVRTSATAAAVVLVLLLRMLISASDSKADPPIGSLDAAFQSGNALVASGWAIDPWTTNPINVAIYLDGTYVTQVTAADARPDVAGVYPPYGANHGWHVSMAPAEGRHVFCAYGINSRPNSGPNSLLGCQAVAVSYAPTGSFDTASVHGQSVTVTGWAVDPRVANGLVNVAFYVDSNYLTQVTASLPRADIATVYPNLGQNHAFSATFSLPDATHSICAYAISALPSGPNTLLACKTVTVNTAPFGSLDAAIQTPGAVSVSGWAVDPTTGASINVALYVDGTYVTQVTAAASRPDVAQVTGLGPAHGYNFAASVSQGTHSICTFGITVHSGSANGLLGCQTVTFNFNPVGAFDSATRLADGTIRVSGWALDPDVTTPITVAFSENGTQIATTPASSPRADIAQVFPSEGPNHAFTLILPPDDSDHMVCATAINVGFGTANTSLGCLRVPALHPNFPGAPVAVVATPSFGSVAVSWSPPASDGGSPLTRYVVVDTHNTIAVEVSPTTSQVLFNYLTPGTTYQFVVYATNAAGNSNPSVASNIVTISATPAPQTTPPPPTTSHYVRNISGAASDATTWWSNGRADASQNVTGLPYLVLLHIGGQASGGGVYLSASSIFVSDAAVVNAVNAYVAGYASAQVINAPVVIAVGTNSDVTVTAASGAEWASIVNQVQAFAAKYPFIRIAGANDMEPGFRATPSQIVTWESAYLGATSAQLIFDGSADGCPSSGADGSAACNNGWTPAILYKLAGGLSPTRIFALPQIYNATMARQWANISNVGTRLGQPKIQFYGPLTEQTACAQAGTCGSLPSAAAWNDLWTAIQSITATRQVGMPYATDLRIN
jgi:hypothetical protein